MKGKRSARRGLAPGYYTMERLGPVSAIARRYLDRVDRPDESVKSVGDDIGSLPAKASNKRSRSPVTDADLKELGLSSVPDDGVKFRSNK